MKKSELSTEQKVEKILQFDFQELNPVKAGSCRWCSGSGYYFDADSIYRTLKIQKLLYIDYFRVIEPKGQWLQEENVEFKWKHGRPNKNRVAKGFYSGALGVCELSICSNGSRYILRGDTLLTYKSVIASALSKMSDGDLRNASQVMRECEISKKDEISNNHTLASFFVMPFRPRYGLNAGRPENPFRFLSHIKELYIEGASTIEYLKGTMGRLKANAEFFRIFGNEEEGYKKLLSTFCLDPIEEMSKESDWADIVFVGRAKNVEQVQRYIELMRELKSRREKLIKERLVQFDRFNIASIDSSFSDDTHETVLDAIMQLISKKPPFQNPFQIEQAYWLSA